MTRVRRILLITYFYPPLRSVGVRRPAALAKYLARAGHDVTVVTSRANGSEPAAEDADHRPHVVPVGDLLATRLNWRRERRRVATNGEGATWRPGANLWGSIVVPDLQLLTWGPSALRHALRIAHTVRPDVVITTSPTESAHLVGLALRRYGVPWIADLRDGWRFESSRPAWPVAFQRMIDERLEATVVRRADAVVSVTRPIAEDLNRRHGANAEVITNGFDPEDAPHAATGLLSGHRHSIVHTGGLGPSRSIEPLLAAAGALRARGLAIDDRLEIVLAGSLTDAERKRLAEPGVTRLVRHVGYLDRPQALSLQREADTLLLVTSAGHVGEATGKLYEYLASGRPILVLGPESEAARIVRETGAGRVVDRTADAVGEALLELIDGRGSEYRSETTAQYLYPALVSRYQRLIERVLKARQ